MKMKKLVCPKCGYTGDREGEQGEGFRYLEDIICWREIEEEMPEGMIVDGLYHTTEGYDNGTNPRIECMNCLYEWKPDDMKVADWR